MRLRSFDNLLVGMMSMVALVCLYMLYGVRFYSKSSTNEIKVASIVEQIKTVKRKKDFYQSWTDVSAGDDLSLNDEIYTHEQSSAKINFTNGQEINLFENSLLKIKTLNNSSTLALDKGNLTAKLSANSPKLDVVLNGKKYSFESQNANIQIEQGDSENKVLLLDGKAKLNIDQKSNDLKANEVLIQNKKTGAIKIKELPFSLKYPSQNVVNYFAKEKEIVFKWAYTNGAAPVRIRIAKDSKFSNIIRNEIIESDHLNLTLNDAGTYFWKLSTLDSADNLESPIRNFTLKEELPLSINLDKTKIFKGPKKAEKVFINWSKGDAKNYLLNIEHPNKEIETLKLTQNNYEFKANDVGSYQFTVKVNENSRPSALWSAPETLEVIEATAISIKSNTTDTIERVNYNKGPLSQILSWIGPDSDVTYKVKLTKDNEVKTFETESTTFPINLPSSGVYRWEVEGVSSSGVSSNTISGNIILKAPVQIMQTPSEGAVIELEKPDQLVSFKWDQVENVREYQFELSNDPSFQKIIYQKDIDNNNVSTTVGETGKYFWRVKIKKGDNVEYSSPVSVEIRPTPPLERPEIAPDIKIKIKYLDDKTSEFHLIDLFINTAEAEGPVAVAEWDLPANTRAKKYIVEIYEDQNLTKLITRIETAVPHVIWKNATLGTFYWRVSYEDFWGRKTEFSKISKLEAEVDPAYIKPEPPKIVEKIPPPPIELIAPKHKESILQNIDDEFQFKWSPLSEAKTYQFMIYNDQEAEKTLIKTKVSSSEVEIHCKELQNLPGDYHWKVISDSGSTSKRRMFHINCTPKKIEEPIAPIASTPAPSPVEEKKNLHFARLGFYPHHLTYENKSTNYSAKVSGNVLDSWYGMYQTPVEWKYFTIFNSSLFVSRGKVFNSITFTDVELNLKAHKTQSSFSWGPVIAFMKKTLYVESNLAISSSSQSSPLLGLFIQKNFERTSLNAEAKFGGALDFHADALYDVKKNISVGPFVDFSSITKDGNKHSFTRFGLNLNYTFLFLEKTK